MKKNHLLSLLMNFLAHIYLSGDNEQRVVGNFIGDFVKGKQWQEYPKEIQEGILLHRFIDNFTDTHPVVLQSIARIKPIVGRFAGIVADVFYDYCLAQNFGKLSEVALPTFAQNSYDILTKHHDILPTRVQELLPYMRQEDWLTHYGSLYGITKALQGLTRRLKYVQDLTKTITLLENNYQDFENDFQLFFPDIQKAVKEKIIELLSY